MAGGQAGQRARPLGLLSTLVRHSHPPPSPVSLTEAKDSPTLQK